MINLKRMEGRFYLFFNKHFDPNFKGIFFKENKTQFYQVTSDSIVLIQILSIILSASHTAIMLGVLSFIIKPNKDYDSYLGLSFILGIIIYSCLFFIIQILANKINLKYTKNIEFFSFVQIHASILGLVYLPLLFIGANFFNHNFNLTLQIYNILTYIMFSIVLGLSVFIWFFINSPYFIKQYDFICHIIDIFNNFIKRLVTRMEIKTKPKSTKKPKFINPLEKDFKIIGHKTKEEKKLENLL